jgi:hypothetical protein
MTIINKIFLLFMTCFSFSCVNAQSPNIGIGTSSPQARLDVLNSIRVGGLTPNSSFLFYDSTSGNFTWKNSSLFVPGSQPLIRHSATGLQGLYYNSGQLQYQNDVGVRQFSTNWITGDGYVATNLGLGRNNPQIPLHFASALGEKIIFYGGPGPNYGIGIQPSELQIHTDLPESSITFGYGGSTNFTELVRIVGDGRMGIGTNNPQSRLDVRRGTEYATAEFWGTETVNGASNTYFNAGALEYTYIRGNKIILNDIPGGKVGIGVEPFISDGVLDIGGRVRIRGAEPQTTAVYFTMLDNHNLGGYIGTSATNPGYLLINNGTAGYEFGINYQTGAVKMGMNQSGTAGQLLVSGGPGNSPKWRSPLNMLFNNTTIIRVTGDQFINSSTAVDLNGMSRLITVSSATANILFSYNIVLDGDNDNAGTIMDIVLDGVIMSRSIHLVGNNRNTVTGTMVIPTTSGNHTIKMMASSLNGAITVIPGIGFGLDDTVDCMFIQILNK